jgi:copper chaperone CopZ
MTHEFSISGMTCGGCVTNVKKALEQVQGIRSAHVTLDPPIAILDMDRHIGLDELKAALKSHPKYQISEAPPKPVKPEPMPIETEEKTPFFKAYKPILLIFGYILGVTLLVELTGTNFDGMRWMRHFMAGFFLVFSFFKLLDVPAFAMSYSSYDVVARRWLGWGYIYPFVELTFGILFLTNFQPIFTNAATVGVMGISTVGVIQSLMAKRKFQCACLGAVFNLPMSTITLVEDLLMVGMAGAMLLWLL